MSLVNIDVTLRDGGYRNGFGFDLDYARAHARLSLAAGFDWVEIAYRKGSFKPVPKLGLTGRGDDDYIEAIAGEVGAEHVGLILHPRNIDDTDLPAMYRAGARLVRVCVAAGDPQPAFDAVRRAREIGFTTCVNLTRVTQLPARKVVDLAVAAAEAGAEVVYLADSNGSMLPEQTARLTTLVKSVANVEVGLHAHNNLGLAMSNAMSAVDAGATWMDSSVLGMGKGPGNLVAEQWIAYLERTKLVTGYDLGTVLHLADLLGRSVPESAPSLPLPDLVLGHFDLSVELRGDIVEHDDHRLAVHTAKSLAAG
ncbi:nucleoid-structuring protein H-NS [Lentzea sp. NBRC 105346]|uniref:hypothetical protein n=1 Tax=Lentzea sp. NBRC 105346 TaxID=3032205 RepID=UPI0024A0FA0E|nr:hypothetical protein [Lentzea sp. NBRC 105346]GLZ29265.1 nucleoid-structuring protein H-NS [Lentzea sp. NBRC 105346]